MYKIIGADQKQYGPLPSEQIRQWIAEGRLNGQTPACLEGTAEWKPLAMFPEFGLGGSAPGGVAPVIGDAGALPAEELLARDYHLDIGGCIGRGWSLVTENFGLLFCASLIYFGIEMGIGLFGN